MATNVAKITRSLAAPANKAKRQGIAKGRGNKKVSLDGRNPREITKSIAGIESMTNQVSGDLDSLKGLSPELAFQISATRPGVYNTPYVRGGVVDPSVSTGIATGYVELACTASSQATFPCTIIMLSTDPNYCGGGGVKMAQLTDATAFSTADLGTGFTSSEVWGITTGFTDKYQIYQLCARLTIRAAAANIAGVAYVGRISRTQLASSSMTLADFRRVGIEIDLKSNTTFELRANILDRESMHSSGTTLSEEESFTYAILPSNVALSTSTAAVMDYTVAVSVAGNYAWIPDFKTPALMSVTTPPDWPAVAPDPWQAKVCDTLTKSNNGCIPMRREDMMAVLNLIFSHSRQSMGNLRRNNQMAIEASNSSQTSSVSSAYSHVVNDDHRCNLQGHPTVTGWSDLVNYGKAVYSHATGIANNLMDWAIANAICLGKRYAVGAVMHLLADANQYTTIPPVFIDDYNWLDWTLNKTQRVCKYNLYDPVTLSIWDEMVDSTLSLMDRLENLNKVHYSCDELYRSWHLHKDRRGVLSYRDQDDQVVDPQAEYDRIRKMILHDDADQKDIFELPPSHLKEPSEEFQYHDPEESMNSLADSTVFEKRIPNMTKAIRGAETSKLSSVESKSRMR